MPILSDFIVLAAAIGASYIIGSYIAPRVWRYAAALRNADRHELVRILRKAIQTLNESSNIWVKLSQLEVALDTAQDIGSLLPGNPAVHDQIAHLEAVRIRLSNHALRSSVDKRLARMRAATDRAEKVQLGQTLLQLLAQQEKTQAPDPQLIDHYRSAIQRYVEDIEQTPTRKTVSEDQGDPAHSGEILDAHHSLAEFSLDSDVPPGVPFLHQAEFRLGEITGRG